MDDDLDQMDAGPTQRTIEASVAVTIIAFGLIVMAGSLQAGIDWGAEGPRAGFFPFYIGAIIAGASAVNLAQTLLRRGPARVFASWTGLRRTLSVIVPTAVYVILVPWTGIYAASALLIAAFMRWFGHYPWLAAASVALGVPAVIFVVFEYWFLLPLPKGPIENFLGV